jgi:hypothetical protein
MIVFGLPLFGLFRRQHWLAWWQVSLGGLLVGLLAGSVLAAVTRAVNVYVLLFGGVGLVSGYLFWVISVFHNRALTTASIRRHMAAADTSR